MPDSVLLNDGGREASASLLAGAELGDWVALLKPRVVALVVFTGVVGLLIAPGGINPVLGFTAVLCIAIGAGAAGAINMWYDRDIDAVMRRTSRRPIPAGTVLPGEALGFGVTLAVGSVLLMYLATNAVVAVALAVSILFYVLVYTMWLKRRTSQNIVIGGAAGAFPPVVGWAAVTGHVGIYPLILFLVVFLWTPPHFWSLSLYACKDYERAGVPMLPVVAGARVTRWSILGYALALLPVSLLPWMLGYTGWIYGGTAAVLGMSFIACAVLVLRDRQDESGRSLTGDRPARRAFRFSLGYLAVLFAAALVDSWVL